MDIYQILQDDHRKVMDTLDRITVTTDAQQRSNRVRQLMSLLLPHASGEETLVYPILRDEAGDADMADHAVAEHHEARVLVNQIAQLECMDPAMIGKVKELRDCLQAHVEEEEGEIFDQLRGVLTDKQAREIGKQFIAFKKQCQTPEGQIRRRAA
jgi:hemerythrin superfamily protein